MSSLVEGLIRRPVRLLDANTGPISGGAPRIEKPVVLPTSMTLLDAESKVRQWHMRPDSVPSEVLERAFALAYGAPVK